MDGEASVTLTAPQDWAVEEGCEDAFLRRALQPRS